MRYGLPYGGVGAYRGLAGVRYGGYEYGYGGLGAYGAYGAYGALNANAYRGARVNGLAGRGASRDRLGQFLGRPSDGGLHGLAGDQARPDGARYAFGRRDWYSADWYRRYPGAWYPGLWGYGDVWGVVPWATLMGWWSYGTMEPVDYDYGNNITYQNNAVYMNGQQVATADEYYQQAQQLATTADASQDTSPQNTKEEWMPLGVFTLSHRQQADPNLVIQLAVNKDGVIRGNYTAELTDDTLPIHGSVDKKTQRAAWTIGANKTRVMETGIYNLTKDEAPVLVHFSKDRVEQWHLVRIHQPEDQSDAADGTQPPRPAANNNATSGNK